MRVEVLTDRDDRLTTGSRLFAEGEDVARGVLAVESGGRVPIIRLEGVETREQAEAMRGRYLEIEQEPLPEGQLYWHQVVGLLAMDDDGAELGTVVEVFRAGENEVYRIEAADGAELLVPALREVVRRIDLDAGTMTVNYETEEVR